MVEYTLSHHAPSVSDYRRLRKASGLSEKTEAAAALALPNTWFGVQVLHQRDVVGMGRIIGDGGCHFVIVDIAVLPEHQGRGLGKRIMSALMTYFKENAPESAYLSLLADGKAKDLYAQFGFKPTAPASIGMKWRS